jgi:hypothetical protein
MNRAPFDLDEDVAPLQASLANLTANIRDHYAFVGLDAEVSRQVGC